MFELTVIFTRPSFPFLVVITMAPLAASEPYKAAAAAPVRTDIDSISSGLISAIGSLAPRESNSVPPLFVERPEKMGTPSITYKALDDCIMDFVPRITTFDTPPTPDEDALILTPATFPLKELTKLASLLDVISSVFTCCTL